ncbi:hypothetical protein [Chromobacterium sp. Panama]|uniref:hypothetical protein n=1 Tax=Chromobacterium sp. Panama TaxID=2161826 RepID=UPI0011B1EE54|nr:hypothetical protein [Chromobacterium sp. Panama]
MKHDGGLIQALRGESTATRVAYPQILPMAVSRPSKPAVDFPVDTFHHTSLPNHNLIMRNPVLMVLNI